MPARCPFAAASQPARPGALSIGARLRAAHPNGVWQVAMAVAIGIGSLAALACDTSQPSATPSPDRPARGGPPDVILITLDTFRRDRLGAYGNQQIDTPHLDRLAAESATFLDAVSPIPSTLPSHAAILTGRHPAALGIHDNGVYFLDTAENTLAEAFRERGYATGAFVSAFVLERRFGLAQGFEIYDDEMEEPLIEASVIPEDAADDTRRWYEQLAAPYQRRGQRVSERALAWLNDAAQRERPVFLWAHYFDAHEPYDAPEPYTTLYDPDYAGAMNGSGPRYMRTMAARQARGEPMPRRDRQHMVARYDGEISYVDAQVGALFEGLRASGRFRSSWIIVVGDHGESFGEHGLQIWEHNGSIHEEVLRVPLLIRRPGAPDAGARIGGLVATYDVAATLWEALGLARPATSDAISLLPILDGAAGGRPSLVIEALREAQAFERPHSWLGLRTATDKLIVRYDRGNLPVARRRFDLTRDPHERRPLAPNAERLAMLERKLLDAVAALDEGARPVRDIGQPTRDALRALGYAEDEP